MGKLKKMVAQASERHLDKDETVIAAVLGTYEKKVMGSDFIKAGVFVATPKRLVFFSKGWFSETAEVFPLSSISSFETGKTMMGHYFKFFASGNEVSMKWIQEGDIAKFNEFVRGGIGKQTGASSPPRKDSDIPDQIAKLAVLKAGGVLSEQEFESKKRELLARM